MPRSFADVKELDIVYVTKIVKDPKVDSAYYNGEYLVISIGAAGKSFTGCKLVVGYGLQEASGRTFSELDSWEIHEIYQDANAIKKCIADNEEFLRGPRKQWVSTVYDNVEQTLRRLKRLLVRKYGNCQEPAPSPEICHNCAETANLVKQLRGDIAALAAHLGCPGKR